MSKKNKILLSLLVFVFLIFLFLIINAIRSEEEYSLSNSNEFTSVDKKAVLSEFNLAELENDYKIKTANIFKIYLKLIESEELKISDINKIKLELLELKMPTKFKDLHLNFVLALNKMEKYLENNEEEDRLFSQSLIKTLETNYIWLEK